MSNYWTLCHTKWECKYHVVFIPKYRRKVLYGQLRRHLGEVLRRLAEQKESAIEEGHLMPDHVHVLIAIPPKFSVAGDRVHQGQERDSHCAQLRRAEAELRRAAFLGPRLLRIDSGPR